MAGDVAMTGVTAQDTMRLVRATTLWGYGFALLLVVAIGAAIIWAVA